MKKGVRHTTNEMMAFIRKAEEIGITAACKEYDIHYTTGRRWIANHSLPGLQESSEENMDMITDIDEETVETELPVQFSEPLPVPDESEAGNTEPEETELYKEYGALILENERLKMRVRQLSRALAAIAAEE